MAAEGGTVCFLQGSGSRGATLSSGDGFTPLHVLVAVSGRGEFYKKRGNTRGNGGEKLKGEGTG